MIRVFDFTFALLGLIILLPIGILLFIILLFDTGVPVLVQKRIGRHKKPFTLYKFRTMTLDTPETSSHEADGKSITRIGHFLRKIKLDEIPQLFNVLRGDMSLVGPRPVIPCQEEVMIEREKEGVYEYLPGITGLAQINRIDTSMPKRQAKVDIYMLKHMNLKVYFGCIMMTAFGKGWGDCVKNPIRT